MSHCLSLAHRAKETMRLERQGFAARRRVKRTGLSIALLSQGTCQIKLMPILSRKTVGGCFSRNREKAQAVRAERKRALDRLREASARSWPEHCPWRS